jgi:hypothetical protein
VGKHLGKCPLGKLRIWENNIKLDLRDRLQEWEEDGNCSVPCLMVDFHISGILLPQC